MAPIPPTPTPLSLRRVRSVGIEHRVVVALGLGLLAGIVCYLHLVYFEPQMFGMDFTWPWRAARALLAGRNPYDIIRPDGDFPFNAYFKYPLPAALLALPLAWMSAPAATAVFGGVSTGLLAYGLSDDGFGRLIILASPPYLTTLLWGQWSTLLMAGALLPALSWVAICKPTVGMATFAARPNWSAVIGGGVIVAVCFALVPSWVADWVRTLRTAELGAWYMAPVTLTGGPVLLLGLLRWRLPEARFLVAVAVTPHVLGFYTGFLPMLVAKTRREAMAMSLLAVAASVVAGRWHSDGPALWGYSLLVFLFVPALVMVLSRPNRAEAVS